MADGNERQTIEIEYVVIADKATQDAQKLHERTKQAIIDMQATAAKSGASFKEVATSMKAAYGEEQLSRIKAVNAELKQLKTSPIATTDAGIAEANRLRAEIQQRTADYKQYKTAVTNALTEINAKQKQVTASTREMGAATSTLGSIGKFVFGGILGITALSAIRELISGFKELTKAGFDYAQALLRLEASTQILQESGMNISMKETLELVTQLNKEFPIFSRKAIVEGLGYIQLLSQNLTLTNDQMKNLAEVAGGLAVVLGKDVNEASKELALFLSSGYGEALQRAGILASKASVQHELLAMGITTGYNETDAATRAQAGYNVIMQQSEKIVNKAIELQKDQAFAVERSKGKWDDAKYAIGDRLVPAMANLYDIGTKVADAILWVSTVMGKFNADVAVISTQITGTLVTILKLLSTKPTKLGIQEALEDMTKIWSKDTFKSLQDVAREGFLPDIYKKFTDSAIGAGNAAEEQAMIIADSVKLLNIKLLKEQEKFADDLRDLNLDFIDDINELGEDADIKIGESWLDYFADMAAIWRKSYDDIIGENIKFQLDLTQLNRDFDSKRADADQKYRDKEYKAQKDFEEKMRRLREEFLFDLEDALRERDARQVLRLIRRFNLEQARLERERDSERDDRQREYRRELDDIEKQRAERLLKLNEEHQARIAEIKRQEAIELRELKAKHDAEIAEINRRLAQEKADRADRYKEQQAEMVLQFQERFDEITLELLKEYNLTSQMVSLIGAEYTRVYGPNGVIQSALASYIAYLNGIQNAIENSMPKQLDFKDISGIPKSTPNTKTKDLDKAATGRTNWLATSPQIIQVGEIPEMINITPLNRMGSDMGSKDGTIAIELWLSPDLQARVMDNTLDAVANIMLDIQRRR